MPLCLLSAAQRAIFAITVVVAAAAAAAASAQMSSVMRVERFTAAGAITIAVVVVAGATVSFLGHDCRLSEQATHTAHTCSTSRKRTMTRAGIDHGRARERPRLVDSPASCQCPACLTIAQRHCS